MERKDLVYDIAKHYICKYTCAVMSDIPGQFKFEADLANDWLFQQINNNHITKEEFKEAVEKIEQEAAENGTACVYANDLFSTKFFRS